jgi:lipid-A-disaccharide synthase
MTRIEISSSTPILMVAGEASGEMYGADLASALRGMEPEGKISFFGCGGPRMREAGVETLVDIHLLAVLGPFEAATHLWHFFQAIKLIREESKRRKPAWAILIDFPDFNLRLARHLKAMGIRVVYFVSPQIWAWRIQRVRQIQRFVDRMIVILPFEKEFYSKFGVKVDYVGHPLVDRVVRSCSRDDFLRKNHLPEDRTIICLLPGSRSREIHYHLPTLLAFARRFSWTYPVLFLLPVSSSANRHLVETKLREESPGLSVKIIDRDIYDAIGTSDLAIVASGTATLETALLGVPLMAIFKISNLTWIFGQYLVRTPHYCLVNLIAGERIVPELYQSEFTEERLWTEARRIIDDPAHRDRVKMNLAGVRKKLGTGGAIRNAAEIIHTLLST